MDALRRLFADASDRRWCVRPYCTTCGARDYRKAVHVNAVALVESLRSLRVDDLRREFPRFDVDDALRLLMMELATPFGPLFGRTRALDSELAGTEAGEYLAEMRQHAQALAEERAEREAYESPEAVAERRRAKQEQRAAGRRARKEQREARERVTTEALEVLNRLEPDDLLRRVIAEETGVSLYRLSAALVDSLVGEVDRLTDTDLLRLRGVVPVTRVRPLVRLSKAIDREHSMRTQDGAKNE